MRTFFDNVTLSDGSYHKGVVVRLWIVGLSEKMVVLRTSLLLRIWNQVTQDYRDLSAYFILPKVITYCRMPIIIINPTRNRPKPNKSPQLPSLTACCPMIRTGFFHWKWESLPTKIVLLVRMTWMPLRVKASPGIQKQIRRKPIWSIVRRNWFIILFCSNLVIALIISHWTKRTKCGIN